MSSNPRRRRNAGVLLAAVVVAVSLLLSTTPILKSSGAVSILNVQKTSSGLVTRDPLNTGDTSLWTFGGDAVGYGAPYQHYEDSTGLHIGVQALNAGSWAGYYAARAEQAGLFHATLSLPSSTISAAENFNTGLYVQTGGTDVDYVTCAGGVNNQGYFWTVVEAVGNQNGATQFNTLWFQWMGGQPLTRDCTIITNGSNILKVYLDGTLVFSSSSMNLGYQYPLTAFLEVQSTDNTAMHFSTYTDYYATTSDSVTVAGAPPGSTAQLVDPSGRVLASAPADLSGTARLDIGMYAEPLQANVVVSLQGAEIATTSAPMPVYGGDSFAVTSALGGGSSASTPSGPFTVNPSTTSSINVNVGEGIQITGGNSSLQLCLLESCV